MRHIISILSLIFIFSNSYGQEINNIEPNKFLNDSIGQKPVMNNDFYDFITKEIIKNHLKDTLKLPKSYEEFKIRFLALNLHNEPLDIGLPKAKPGTPQLLDEKYLHSIWFALNSPVSFLYYNLSKTERSKRHFYEIRFEKDQYAIIDKKINRHKIQYWTGLKEEDLDKFILFCDFSFDYMLTTSEYDLIIKVKEKLEEFKKACEPKPEKDSL